MCVLTWWDLADCCWVPAVALVAVGRLDKNGTVTKALSKHLATNVVQPHSSSDVPSRELHCCIPVHIREQTKAEAFRIRRVSETIHGHGGLRGVERLPHALVEFIVGYGAPERRLAVGNGLQIAKQPASPTFF